MTAAPCIVLAFPLLYITNYTITVLASSEHLQVFTHVHTSSTHPPPALLPLLTSPSPSSHCSHPLPPPPTAHIPFPSSHCSHTLNVCHPAPLVHLPGVVVKGTSSTTLVIHPLPLQRVTYEQRKPQSSLQVYVCACVCVCVCMYVCVCARVYVHVCVYHTTQLWNTCSECARTL